MMPQPIEHRSFVIERELPGTARHAFRFWSDPALKERWSNCHSDWTVLEEQFDFRTGGAEVKRWQLPDGNELAVRIHYLDIVAEQRIIYAYEMSFSGERLSASLVTIVLTQDGSRTHMKFTEQAAFLTGEGAIDQRIAGTNEGLDRLVAAVTDEALDG